MHYLANLGHDSVYYLPGPENLWAAADRESAAAVAADEAGVQLELGPAGAPSFEAGVGHADRLMRGPLPTAILCFNDVMALGVLSRLLAVGVRVPERVSVCGWGGTRLAGVLHAAAHHDLDASAGSWPDRRRAVAAASGTSVTERSRAAPAARRHPGRQGHHRPGRCPLVAG